ncbi:MAG: MobF family relaxase [Terriglobia bacterium]
MSKEPLNAAQVRSYHENDFVNAEQRYYSENSAVTGEWQGQLAAEWGLRVDVRDDQFYRLTEGQHPITGEQMVRHRIAAEYKNQEGQTVSSVAHRAGWDATFNAPKSVSIAALVGGDNAVREAHRESVRIALEELERYTQVRIGGNHPAETTGKIIAAKFEHDSARPVKGYSAPHLHTHVVIFNVTETADGKTHALQPREFYRSQQYATAVYQSELVSRLRQLGYEVGRDHNRTPQIQGFTQEYLDASSPRRKQIEKYLAAEGLEGYGAAQIAAHRTREGKVNLRPEEMQRVNRALAAEYGNDPVAVVARAKVRRLKHENQTEHGLGTAKIAYAALTFARDRNIEREAVVDERSLLRDALGRSLGEARLPDLRTNLESRIRSGEFVQVHIAQGSDRKFTTARMLAYERENLSTMTSGQYQAKPLVRPEMVQKLHNEIQRLNPAQRQAATEILQSEDKITGLQGSAGTGKTTTLAAIRRAGELEGYEIQGFAPTSRAAHQLEEAGIRSTTLQHFLSSNSAFNSDAKRLYVLDESSLASTRQVNEFFKRMLNDDRVLLVGDIRQHQAIEAGRPFQQMQEAGMRTARQEEIIRQQDPKLRNAVGLLAQGEVKEALWLLDQQSRIHEVRDAHERLSAIAREYLKDSDHTLVVAPGNASRAEINRLIHENLQADGKVSREGFRFKVLVNRHELTGADREWAAKYQPGDVIRYSHGSREIGLKKGEYATVAHSDAKANWLAVRRENGQQVTYDPKRLKGVNVYRIEERYFAAGERIQFTAPFKDRGIPNRQLATIEQVDAEGNLRIKLGARHSAQFNLREHPHLDYGYAMTSHSSQGQTVDRVIVHVSAKDAHNAQLVNQRFAYVALSRARYDARIYTHDAESLTKKLSRDVSKQAALKTDQGEEQTVRKTKAKGVEQVQTGNHRVAANNRTKKVSRGMERSIV